MHVIKVLKALADEDSISLFDAIASSYANGKGNIDYISHLNITRKQYYSRTRSLTNAGLITKMKGHQNYRLTIYGEAVSHFLELVKVTSSEDTYLKIKAIDAILHVKKGKDVENENVLHLIDKLIDNHKAKDTLLGIFKRESNRDNGENNDGDKSKKRKAKTMFSIL